MFFHNQGLQFEAKPDGPDAAFAKKLQELIGGKWGEMTVAMQYLFQGWNCRLPGKYKDMLLDIGTEELAHVEMLSVMVARLLDAAPISAKEAAADENPMLEAIFGGMNPQHAIHNGLGASPQDSMGNPWNGLFITSSGNLLADFHLNATAEMQGRLQACRIYEMADDPGVRELLSFLIARDHMHQMQWLRAIEEVEAEGLDKVPVPSAFPLDREQVPFAYQYIHVSDGDAAAQGRWAGGRAVDGSDNEITIVDHPSPGTDSVVLPPPTDPRIYGTPPVPPPAAGLVDKAKDLLT
jgi:Mn-containing catalase